MKRYALSFSLVAAALLAPSIASAQYAPPPVRRIPTYLNDGLVVRAGLGVGYLHDTITNTNKIANVSDATDTKLTGLGVPVELTLGVTIGRQLIIGGQATVTTVANPQYTYGKDSQQQDVNAVNYTIGPFLEYYPSVYNGFHLQAMAGFGGLTLKPRDSNGQSQNVDTPWVKGFAGSVGVGQNWRFARTGWSLGVIARVQYQYLVGENDVQKQTHSLWVPGVLATLSFN